jgi:hypothetical protein
MMERNIYLVTVILKGMVLINIFVTFKEVHLRNLYVCPLVGKGQFDHPKFLIVSSPKAGVVFTPHLGARSVPTLRIPGLAVTGEYYTSVPALTGGPPAVTPGL